MAPMEETAEKFRKLDLGHILLEKAASAALELQEKMPLHAGDRIIDDADESTFIAAEGAFPSCANAVAQAQRDVF